MITESAGVFQILVLQVNLSCEFILQSSLILKIDHVANPPKAVFLPLIETLLPSELISFISDWSSGVSQWSLSIGHGTLDLGPISIFDHFVPICCDVGKITTGVG